MGGRGRRPRFSTVQPRRRLGTAEARNNLPQLVRELAGFEKPASSLVSRAIEVGPHLQGGVWVVPEVDAQAAIERQERLAERVVELEDLLEDLSAAPIIAERSETPVEEWETADEFAAGLGLSDVLESARAAIAQRSA